MSQYLLHVPPNNLSCPLLPPPTPTPPDNISGSFIEMQSVFKSSFKGIQHRINSNLCYSKAAVYYIANDYTLLNTCMHLVPHFWLNRNQVKSSVNLNKFCIIDSLAGFTVLNKLTNIISHILQVKILIDVIVPTTKSHACTLLHTWKMLR